MYVGRRNAAVWLRYLINEEYKDGTDWRNALLGSKEIGLQLMSNRGSLKVLKKRQENQNGVALLRPTSPNQYLLSNLFAVSASPRNVTLISPSGISW